ncbi:MAG: DUF4230 domain-containing protein, partial [Acidimicrobiales bacterium]
MLMKNPQPSRFAQGVRSLTGLVVVLAAVAAAVVLGWRLLDGPFGRTEVDHSAPPVLIQLRDLAEFHAAQGQFEVTVDVEQDVKWVPSWLAGERVQFVAVGTVDAVVDFGTLNEGSFQVDDTTKSVVVTLGSVRLQEPQIDLETSHVMNRDRGLLDRLGGVFTDSPTSERHLYELADDKIAAAAAATGLAERAQQNTTNTLTAMLRSLGFEHVEVRYQVWSAGPPASPASSASSAGTGDVAPGSDD